MRIYFRSKKMLFTQLAAAYVAVVVHATSKGEKDERSGQSDRNHC